MDRTCLHPTITLQELSPISHREGSFAGAAQSSLLPFRISLASSPSPKNSLQSLGRGFCTVVCSLVSEKALVPLEKVLLTSETEGMTHSELRVGGSSPDWKLCPLGQPGVFLSVASFAL